MTFDARSFRNALGQFATGVAIVAAEVDGMKLGATISSFNSVSLDPPLVLFSLASQSLGIAQWKAAEAIAIFILGEHQMDLSNRFAKAGGDKWGGISERTTSNGAPALPGAIAQFDCKLHAIYPGGDHEIFVCEVTHFETAGTASQPLVFQGGKYRSLKPLDTLSVPPAEDMWLHGW
jgi:flavin reductase (DIM6/NTAB) family NADH-FMN oxidoreductase RutF